MEAESALHAKQALLPGGWRRDVRVSFRDGLIAEVETDVTERARDERHQALVPAMGNLHSHAFQRAMAGLTETRGATTNSFWSWRDTMYKFAHAMTPEHVEAVAAQLYVEMLEAGFGRVGEFHYLHHDRDGRHYANIAELAERICAASTTAGIGLTLLPVLYTHSGFGGAAPLHEQRRFTSTLDEFAAIMDACRRMTGGLKGARLGVAPHSLRAVTPAQLSEAAALAGDGPIHIHAAEQEKEVQDCLAWSRARPVEWLLGNAAVDRRWCLVHATHMTEEEARALARSGAVAGLCPITEANLGDGTFPAPIYLANEGTFGIGSDSNVDISLPLELRQLEYSQRLSLEARNVVAEPGGSTGRRLFDGALAGGAAALAWQVGIAPGRPADIVSLNLEHAPYLRGDQLLDNWVFSRGMSVDSVWVMGRKHVESGRHRRRPEVQRRFLATMRDLLRES